MTRLRDPVFQESLRSAVFYKQPTDDAFDGSDHALTFGYSTAPRDPTKQTRTFVLIRFPKALAEALAFQPVDDR